MNTAIEDELMKTINALQNSAEVATEFLVEQIPDVLQQLLMWNMVKSLVWMIPAVVLFAAAIRVWKTRHSTMWDGEEPAPYLIMVLLVTVGSPFLIDNLLTILQIWVTPKIFLIEYAAGLAQKAG